MSATARRTARGSVVLAMGVLVLAGCGKSHSNGSSTVSPGGGASTPISAPTTPSTSASGGGYGY